MSRVEFTESLAIIASVIGLWPVVFGYREAWYTWGAIPAMLVLMLWILRRRLQRMNRAFEEARRQMGNDTPEPGAKLLPFAPGPYRDDSEDN